MKYKSLVFMGLSLLCNSLTSAGAINDEVSLDVSLKALTDYRSAGISKSENKPVLQTTASLSHIPSGLSLNVFASNFDVNTEAKYELAYYLSHYYSINKDLSLYNSIGKTFYPKQPEWDIIESNTVLNYKGAYLHYVYNWNKSPFPDAQYRYIGYKYTFPQKYWINAKYGYNDVGFDLGSDRETYNTRSITVGKSFKGLDFALAYIDTDLSDKECTNWMGSTDPCSETAVFSIQKSF